LKVCRRKIYFSRAGKAASLTRVSTQQQVGKVFRLKDHVAIAGKEDKTKEDQGEAQRTFDRRTGELNGSLPGSARFTSLLTHYGQCSIFAANRPH
jgi:hypothetical protein